MRRATAVTRRHTAEMRALIALGSNLGDRESSLAAGLAGLRELGKVTHSPLVMETPDESGLGPAYLNTAAVLDCAGADPKRLLEALFRIELAQGRNRSAGRNAPRTLDLDLLLYGDISLDSDRLTLPHPRGHLRAFVLQPLQELWPDGAWPHRGPLQDLIAGLTEQRIERLA